MVKAIVSDGRIVEVVAIPQGVGVDEMFHPDLAAQIVDVPDDAVAGWEMIDGEWRAPPPAPVAPSVIVVSPRQFRRALLDAGLLDDIERLMTDSTTPRPLRIDWEWATEFRADYPGWNQMLAAIGKTRADLDALFAVAAQVV